MTTLFTSSAPLILSLCDYSGIMVEPWANAGWECLCVDTQHSIRKDRREGNITFTWGDIRSWCPPERARIAALFAFPPCTHVAVSGARDFRRKGNILLRDSLELFATCEMVARYAGCPYFIENPVGVFSTHMGPPNHLFDPCDYAGYLEEPEASQEAYTKKTCLWTGNGFMMPPPKRVEPHKELYIRDISPSPERQNIRSQTPRGFARAVFEAHHQALQKSYRQTA